MNEYTDARLRDELNPYIEQVYGRQQREWRDSGIDVSKYVVFEAVTYGYHTGSVDFYLKVEGKKPQTVRSLVTFVPQKGIEAAHRKVERDWND